MGVGRLARVSRPLLGWFRSVPLAQLGGEYGDTSEGCEGAEVTEWVLPTPGGVARAVARADARPIPLPSVINSRTERTNRALGAPLNLEGGSSRRSVADIASHTSPLDGDAHEVATIRQAKIKIGHFQLLKNPFCVVSVLQPRRTPPIHMFLFTVEGIYIL